MSKLTVISLGLSGLFLLASGAQALPGQPCQKPDLNGDGVVSVDEIVEQRSQHFMRMDINGDGAVSRAEIEEFKAQLREQRSGSRKDRFAQADSNGDGVVSRAEQESVARSKAEAMDSNGDGEVSRREFRQKMAAFRDRMEQGREQGCLGRTRHGHEGQDD